MLGGRPRIQSPFPPPLRKSACVCVCVFARVSGSRALGAPDPPAGAFPAFPGPASQGARVSQERPKGAPRADKSVPSAPQERTRAAQECPRAAQEQPKSGQERPKAAQELPRAAQERPRASKSGQEPLKSSQRAAKRCQERPKSVQRAARKQRSKPRTWNPSTIPYRKTQFLNHIARKARELHKALSKTYRRAKRARRARGITT